MADFNDALTQMKRTSARLGKALVAGDCALSAGFGSTAAPTFATGSTDSNFQLTVTCGGTGQGASPTATITFTDGAWRDNAGGTIVPVCVTSRGTSTDQPTIQFQATCTATTCVLTFTGTASGTQVYVVNCQLRA